MEADATSLAREACGMNEKCKLCGQPLAKHTERRILANDPPERLILRECKVGGGFCLSARVENLERAK